MFLNKYSPALLRFFSDTYTLLISWHHSLHNSRVPPPAPAFHPPDSIGGRFCPGNAFDTQVPRALSIIWTPGRQFVCCVRHGAPAEHANMRIASPVW